MKTTQTIQRFWLPVLFVLALFGFACLEGESVVEDEIGTLGVVSSAHPLATRAGVEILENNGNAFDAAVAVASV
ncbi:gamma-glutamyltransferase, partial [Acidobacteriota bacterium]